jgi:hypothetical protein
MLRERERKKKKKEERKKFNNIIDIDMYSKKKTKNLKY